MSVGPPPVRARSAAHCVDREEIVAVGAYPGDAVTGTARGERALLAARVALKRGNRPLIVDDVQDHRGLIDRSEQQGVVKVRLGTRTLSDPARREMILALERGRHRPAHGLRKLRGEIAGNREQVPRLRVIHDRQLPSLAHVACVREQLAHHIHERDPADDVQPLVAVGRKQHVARTQRHARGNRYRLLTERAHVERDFAGPLRALHAIVEQAREDHVAQADLQILGIETRMPGTHRLAVVVEHTHEFHGEGFHVARARVDFGARDRSRRG